MLDFFFFFLFKVLKFLTTHPFMCKLLASKRQPCSPNTVLFLPHSSSSLPQLHLWRLGHPTLSAMSPSPFLPLLISLWLAELYWGSPWPCRGRFQATLPLSWPHSAHEVQWCGGWGSTRMVSEASVWVTPKERVGTLLFESVRSTWVFSQLFFRALLSIW